MTSLHDFTVAAPGGKQIDLSDKKGKVLLVVNTASQCGLTPQYKGLEALYQKYKDHGFEVLAFPCNQFGGQEPGSEDEISSFCEINFGLSFPLMAKVDVNGPEADPLWDWLKSQQSGLLGSKGIKWNFTKFLVNRDGKVVSRFGSMIKPQQLEKDIEKLL